MSSTKKKYFSIVTVTVLFLSIFAMSFIPLFYRDNNIEDKVNNSVQSNYNEVSKIVPTVTDVSISGETENSVNVNYTVTDVNTELDSLILSGTGILTPINLVTTDGVQVQNVDSLVAGKTYEDWVINGTYDIGSGETDLVEIEVPDFSTTKEIPTITDVTISNITVDSVEINYTVVDPSATLNSLTLSGAGIETPISLIFIAGTNSKVVDSLTSGTTYNDWIINGKYDIGSGEVSLPPISIREFTTKLLAPTIDEVILLTQTYNSQSIKIDFTNSSSIAKLEIIDDTGDLYGQEVTTGITDEFEHIIQNLQPGLYTGWEVRITPKPDSDGGVIPITKEIPEFGLGTPTLEFPDTFIEVVSRDSETGQYKINFNLQNKEYIEKIYVSNVDPDTGVVVGNVPLPNGEDTYEIPVATVDNGVNSILLENVNVESSIGTIIASGSIVAEVSDGIVEDNILSWNIPATAFAIRDARVVNQTSDNITETTFDYVFDYVSGIGDFSYDIDKIKFNLTSIDSDDKEFIFDVPESPTSPGNPDLEPTGNVITVPDLDVGTTYEVSVSLLDEDNLSFNTYNFGSVTTKSKNSFLSNVSISDKLSNGFKIKVDLNQGVGEEAINLNDVVVKFSEVDENGDLLPGLPKISIFEDLGFGTNQLNVTSLQSSRNYKVEVYISSEGSEGGEAFGEIIDLGINSTFEEDIAYIDDENVEFTVNSDFSVLAEFDILNYNPPISKDSYELRLEYRILNEEKNPLTHFIDIENILTPEDNSYKLLGFEPNNNYYVDFRTTEIDNFANPVITSVDKKIEIPAVPPNELYLSTMWDDIFARVEGEGENSNVVYNVKFKVEGDEEIDIPSDLVVEWSLDGFNSDINEAETVEVNDKNRTITVDFVYNDKSFRTEDPDERYESISNISFRVKDSESGIIARPNITPVPTNVGSNTIGYVLLGTIFGTIFLSFMIWGIVYFVNTQNFKKIHKDYVNINK